MKNGPGAEMDGTKVPQQDDAVDLIDALLSKKTKSPPKMVGRPDETDSDETTIEKSPATTRRSPKPTAGRGAPRTTPSKRKMSSGVNIKNSPGLDSAKR